MNYLKSVNALLLISFLGCQSGEPAGKKEPENVSVEIIKRLAATPKSVLDLVKVDNTLWVLKRPQNNAMIEAYLKNMRHHAEFFTLTNLFNFVSKTGSVLDTNDFKGLLIEYLPPPEWSELYKLALTRSQLEDILWQLLTSMEKLNNLTLSSCVLHQENLLVNKQMQIKYIDRDDIDCQIGVSKANNERNDLLALKTILSHVEFVKNNQIHKQYLDHIKQIIETSSSAAMVLKTLRLNNASNYINDLPFDVKNKLLSLIQINRKHLNDQTQQSRLDSVIEVLIKNGVVHFDKAGLAQFYKELIVFAHDDSAKAQDEFSYLIGHGEVQSGYNYYTNPPDPAELLILERWLKAFKAMPLDWAR